MSQLCKVKRDIRWCPNPGGDGQNDWLEGLGDERFLENCLSLSRMGFLDLEVEGKLISLIGRCGASDSEVRKLEVRVCLQNVRGGSAASGQRLSWRLVRKAPSASRSEVK